MLQVTEIRTALAVGVDDAKSHCRVDSSDDDALFERLIKAAMRTLEDRANVYSVPTTLEHRQDCWSEPIVIDAWPIRDVSAVQYLDEDHSLQTVPAANWYWNRENGRAEICFADDFSLPTLSNRPQAVRVAFSAGFDDPANPGTVAATAVDERVAQAVLTVVGHWYENRETVVVGVSSSEVSLAFDALARQLRVFN